VDGDLDNQKRRTDFRQGGIDDGHERSEILRKQNQRAGGSLAKRTRSGGEDKNKIKDDGHLA